MHFWFFPLSLLHSAHQMRYRHKNTKILSSKTDMDSAYRRLHAAIQSALSCITIIEEIAYILFRLPFGAKPAVGIFSILSDITTDLTSEIAYDPTWIPEETHSDLFDLIESLPTKTYDDTIPFGQAEKLFVDIPPTDICFDNYIDDLIGIGIDTERIRKALKHAPPLAFHVLFRPLIYDDPIPRNRIINEIKHPAEGLLEETKRILGWFINFRKFRISLPFDKLKDWSYDLDACLKNKKCKFKVLESLIGRFNHAGYILPFSKYFINRLRYCLKQATKRNYKIVYFTSKELEILSLWKNCFFKPPLKGLI